MLADYCSFIFFAGDFRLSVAERLRKGAKLSVSRHSDQLAIRWNNGPEIRVLLDRGCWVQGEATKIGACSPYAALSKCSARFEIAFDSLDEVSEPNE